MSMSSETQIVVAELENSAAAALSAVAPSLSTFENAAQAAYDPAGAGTAGLRLLTDASGAPVTIATASGVTASAFVDGSGNLVVAYEGTVTSQQTALDVSILSNTAPAAIPGLQDALGFYQHAVAVARGQGLAVDQSYVTGFSLGGTLASYVASQTGAAGAAFASSGVPGYQAPAAPAANFVTYVEAGDPFAQYATDGAEASSAAVGGVHMDHVGTVVTLGTAADAAALQPFAAATAGISFGQAASGAVPLPPGRLETLENDFYSLLGATHTIGRYDGDATAAGLPGGATALQDPTVAGTVALLGKDMPTLAADFPQIAASGSLQAGEALFQQDVPDLARALTEATHAADFGAAIATVLRTDPALAADLGNPAQLSADLAGFASAIGQAMAPATAAADQATLHHRS